MADVYLELSDLEISKEDVFANKDVAELTEWLKEQEGVSLEIAIMLGALKNSPDANTISLSRKLGFVNISIAWIRKRLTELGVTDDRIAPRGQSGVKAHLQQMEAVLRERNAKIKEQNIELTALRQQLRACQRDEVGRAGA